MTLPPDVEPVPPSVASDARVLVNQPTAAPTRKMQAVAVAGLIAPIVAAALVSIFPDLSEACGHEVSFAGTVVVVGLLQGAATFAAGYFRHNAVPVARRRGA